MPSCHGRMWWTVPSVSGRRWLIYTGLPGGRPGDDRAYKWGKSLSNAEELQVSVVNIAYRAVRAPSLIVGGTQRAL